MKILMVALVLLLTTQNLMAFCKAEGLQRDIEIITARHDLTLDQRRKDISAAKDAFKEDIIECAVTGELISEKAANLAITYINADSTTKDGPETQALIKKIKSQIPN